MCFRHGAKWRRICANPKNRGNDVRNGFDSRGFRGIPQSLHPPRNLAGISALVPTRAFRRVCDVGFPAVGRKPGYFVQFEAKLCRNSVLFASTGGGERGRNDQNSDLFRVCDADVLIPASFAQLHHLRQSDSINRPETEMPLRTLRRRREFLRHRILPESAEKDGGGRDHIRCRVYARDGIRVKFHQIILGTSRLYRFIQLSRQPNRITRSAITPHSR